MSLNVIIFVLIFGLSAVDMWAEVSVSFHANNLKSVKLQDLVVNSVFLKNDY